MGVAAAAESRQPSLDALKALAHPVRVQLFSALSSYGPATASALAARLGESSGTTSYHLRQLERHGFVREDTTRGNARDRWWERVPAPIEINEPFLETTPGGSVASDLLEAEFLRGDDERYADYRRDARRLDAAWRAAALSTTTHLHLDAAELTELGRDLEALIARYRGRSEQAPERRRIEVQLRAFPVIDPATQPDLPGTDAGREAPEGSQP